MISYQKGSDTIVVVLHEIYGLNQHIRCLCQDLSRSGFDVLAPDLLGDEQVFTEEQEEEAYQNFIKQIGFDSAARQVKALAKESRKHYRKIILLGFSIGATIAWMCSQEADLCDAVVGFYGSRIRDYLELQPSCPVLLFFPEKEKAFEVCELVKMLNEKEKVWAGQIQGGHGFANPGSIHYNEQVSRQARQETMSFMGSISQKAQ